MIALKKKTIFKWCENVYYMVGWKWNHGMMLWWRFHCTGKYSLGLTTHGPVILAPYWSINKRIHCGWVSQKFLPSFAYYLGSVDYYLVLSVAAANSVGACNRPHPTGWIGIGAWELWCVCGLSTRPVHEGWICVVRGSGTWLVALSSGYSTCGVLRRHKEPGCCW